MISSPGAKRRMFYKLKHSGLRLWEILRDEQGEGGGCETNVKSFHLKQKKKNQGWLNSCLGLFISKSAHIPNNVGIAVILEPAEINLQVKSQCLHKNT